MHFWYVARVFLRILDPRVWNFLTLDFRYPAPLSHSFVSNYPEVSETCVAKGSSGPGIPKRALISLIARLHEWAYSGQVPTALVRK